jgi:DUF1680 family protein
VPGWAVRPEVSVNGQPVEAPVVPGSYAAVRRRWARGDVVTLTMSIWPRATFPNSRVDAVRGCVAIERGPLVYCLEPPDQWDGVQVDSVRIDPVGMKSVNQPNLLGGVKVVKAVGRTAASDAPIMLGATPYYAWANRGKGPMRVWIPRRQSLP